MEIQTWYNELPTVTRNLFTVAFAISCLVNLKLIPFQYIFFSWDSIRYEWELWRIFASVPYVGGFSFTLMINLYFLTNFGGKLENQPCFSKPGDYAWFITVLILFLNVAAVWGDIAYLGQSFIFGIVYYWSRMEPSVQLSVWGFNFEGWLFPYVLLLLGVLTGSSSFVEDLVGLAAGHLYYLLKCTIPTRYNIYLVETPKWFSQLYLKTTARPATTWSAGGPPVNRMSNSTGGVSGLRRRDFQAPPSQPHIFAGPGNRLGD
jgi:Derlin-2/3